MGLFGFGKKKQWDIERSNGSKEKIRALFNKALENGDSWKLLYGYSMDISNMNYVLVRKTTYEYASLIIGYNEADMKIAILETTPELDACSEAEIFSRDNIKKTGKRLGEYILYHKGGLMAGYTRFGLAAENDEKYLAYVYQPEECRDFDEFFKRF